MHEYKVEVTREGKWWMVHVPGVEGVTQARRLAEAATMAREYIALSETVPFDDINVEVVSVRVGEPEFREVLEMVRDLHARRAQAVETEREVSRDIQQFVHWLTTYGVPVRDIAELLDISPQRVSQLANQN
jgi:predicted XRE-type DNA-binding protein